MASPPLRHERRGGSQAHAQIRERSGYRQSFLLLFGLGLQGSARPPLRPKRRHQAGNGSVGGRTGAPHIGSSVRFTGEGSHAWCKHPPPNRGRQPPLELIVNGRGRRVAGWSRRPAPLASRYRARWYYEETRRPHSMFSIKTVLSQITHHRGFPNEPGKGRTAVAIIEPRLPSRIKFSCIKNRNIFCIFEKLLWAVGLIPVLYPPCLSSFVVVTP